MNGIIAALFILMMIAFGVGGKEFADSTGYSYPSLIQVDLRTTEEQFYEYLKEEPEWFINWLYSHYFILDMDVWEKDGDTYIEK